MPRKVKVSYGRTIQSAPYESIRLDLSIEKDIPDDASIKEEFDKTIDGLVKYVKQKVAQIIKDE